MEIGPRSGTGPRSESYTDRVYSGNCERKVLRLTRWSYVNKNLVDWWLIPLQCLHIPSVTLSAHVRILASQWPNSRKNTQRKRSKHVTTISQERVILYGLPTVHIQSIACAILDFLQINFDTIRKLWHVFLLTLRNLFLLRTELWSDQKQSYIIK